MTAADATGNLVMLVGRIEMIIKTKINAAPHAPSPDAATSGNTARPTSSRPVAAAYRYFHMPCDSESYSSAAINAAADSKRGVCGHVEAKSSRCPTPSRSKIAPRDRDTAVLTTTRKNKSMFGLSKLTENATATANIKNAPTVPISKPFPKIDCSDIPPRNCGTPAISSNGMPANAAGESLRRVA